MEKPSYMKWIVKEQAQIINMDKKIKCYIIDYNNDSDILDEWALHIRRHYISDEELQNDSLELDLSEEEYLRTFIIPQKNEGMGPTARSNTISEILFSDLIEFIHGYHVPRYRQYNMSGKTVSEHGTDIIGYKFAKDREHPKKEDRMVAIEVKAKLSSADSSVISEAVQHSAKDEFRVSVSLNYMRKKLMLMGKVEESDDILRFQKKTNSDYHIDYIAAGITSIPSLQAKTIDGEKIEVVPNINGADLVIKDKTYIFFVHGKQLMKLAHEIFERCVK